MKYEKDCVSSELVFVFKRLHTHAHTHAHAHTHWPEPRCPFEPPRAVALRERPARAARLGRGFEMIGNC